MTYIFSVFTDAADGTTLSGNVQYRDPDNYGFSQGPIFGLQLIMDAWEEGRHFSAGLVSAATESEFKELFDLLGGEVRVDEDGYRLEDSSPNVCIPRVNVIERYNQFGGQSYRSHGQHYVKLRPQPAEFARRTAEIIVSWEIREDDLTNLDADEGTSASFTLKVSDPRYLEHLTKNTYFQTTSTGHLPS
ncbi:hypothetical protein [Streptomyces sp. NBC_01727]|uniref:hypothetical protein n=1 Tax=Streptomyces sp. NBC_01727 TaxID=2975924 RepID=UPI002E10A715|nr:hypothetical protein OIE76_43880 [Streptomyces sp. NBC_01727]WSG86754.1 hypothetical protein OIE76_43885 [Streptomyces sp. NBC_01727]